MNNIDWSKIDWSKVFTAMVLAKGPYPEYVQKWSREVYERRQCWAAFYEELTGKYFSLEAHAKWLDWWEQERLNHDQEHQ